MEYVQKIVPISSPMLQVPQGYDVISYRIEHIRTAKNPLPTGEIEKEFLETVPEKYLNKYIFGIKIAPFIRIYRTIASHSEVERFLGKGIDMLSLFKNPQQIKGAKEEICYSSAGEFWRDWGLICLVNEVFRKEELTKEEEREFRKVVVPEFKHGSNKFMRKCLAVDDFFDDVMKYLENPADFYRDKLIKRSVKLDYIFEECDALNTKLPEGFANKTSGLTKRRIAEILTVIETLKWQVGINKAINDEMFNKLFRTKDVLWKSNKKDPLFYDIEKGYIIKDIAADNNCVYTGETESVCPLFLRMNPHKIHFIPSEYFDKPIDLYSEFMGSFGRNIKKTYWTKEKLEADNFTEKVLTNIDIGKLDLDKKSDIDILKKKIAVFNDKFIEEFLDKNVDKYPAFISERLKDVDEYPGIILYMFDKKRRKRLPNEVDPDPLDYGWGSGGECIFNLYESGDGCSVNLIFDLVYLMDYSDILVAAGDAERKGLTVYESLKKMQKVDPKDNITSRFLAELASEEINQNVLLNKWDELSSRKTFKDTEEENDPAEARAVAAFQLYRKTMKELTNAISLVSSLDPTIEFNINSIELPSFYVMVDIYLFKKMWHNYSRIPLNKRFSGESIQQKVSMSDYIKNQNNKARMIRNKITHGKNIDESEFVQFMGFCNKIRRIAEDIIINAEKKIRESREKQQPPPFTNQ